MSEQQQGPGWWLASDGKWYPPEQAPPLPPAETWATPPAGPPPRSGMSGGAIAALAIGGVLGFVVLIGGAVLLARDGDDASSTSLTTEPELDAQEPDATEPDPSDLPEGFAYLEGDGVAIAAPDSWAIVNPDDAALTAEEFAELFPDLEPAMIDQMVAGLEQGALLVAYDLVGGGESNVNIQRIPGEAPLAVLQDEVPRQLAALGGDAVDTAIVDTAAGEALRIEYTLEATLPGQAVSTTTYGVQFYVPIDGRTYIVTISGDEDIHEVGDQMIDTLRAT